MRFRFFSPWLAGAVVAVAGGLWLHESSAHGALQARSRALADAEQRLARQQEERDRLRDELRATEASGGSLPATPVGSPLEAAASEPTWQPGEWTAATAWGNEGRATPQSTLATLLWAASGGDLQGLRDLLSFDEKTLAKARAWFDSLPASSRAQYRTPEELVAGITLGNISPTRAQVSWLHQADSERAIVGLLLANPSPSSAATLEYYPAAGGVPPGFRQSLAPYRVVVLNLQRAPDGWRVQVPAAAIGYMAQWLGRPGSE